jgi:hypothetical protein
MVADAFALGINFSNLVRAIREMDAPAGFVGEGPCIAGMEWRAAQGAESLPIAGPAFDLHTKQVQLNARNVFEIRRLDHDLLQKAAESSGERCELAIIRGNAPMAVHQCLNIRRPLSV